MIELKQIRPGYVELKNWYEQQKTTSCYKNFKQWAKVLN